MSCSSAPSSVSRRIPRHAQPLGDAHGEVDDVLGVVAGVLVVGLQQVAQQERGAAEGAAHLDRLGDPGLALAREVGEQVDEREHEQGGGRRGRGGDRGEQADRGEQRVDEEDLAQLAEDHARRQPGAEVGPQRLADGVGGELRAERGRVGGPVRPGGRVGAERDEHHGGRERERRVGQPISIRGASCRRAASPSRWRPRSPTRRSAARTASAAAAASARRQLRGHREAVAERERDPRDADVRDAERQRERQVQRARVSPPAPRARRRRARTRARTRLPPPARAGAAPGHGVRGPPRSGARFRHPGAAAAGWACVSGPQFDGCPMWSAAQHADLRRDKT